MRFSIILLKYASMGKYLPLFHPEDAAFHVSVCDDILNVHCSPESSSHAASSLHDRALTFVDGTVLTDNDSWMFLSPCCDLHERIRPVFIPSFSRFSESFGDIMCCEWWDSKVFTILCSGRLLENNFAICRLENRLSKMLYFIYLIIFYYWPVAN